MNFATMQSSNLCEQRQGEHDVKMRLAEQKRDDTHAVENAELTHEHACCD